MKVGENEIVAVATNGGSGPNPAGFWFEARLTSAKGESGVVRSGRGCRAAKPCGVGTQVADSTRSVAPSMPVTRTLAPAGSSGPTTRQTLSSTRALPTPSLIGAGAPGYSR